MYRFKKIHDIDKLAGTAKIRNVFDDFTPGRDKQEALFQKKLWALFGAPSFTAKEDEIRYGYTIEVLREDGELFYLSVYDSSSGLAIGSYVLSDYINDAALALIEAIDKAEGVDRPPTMTLARASG